MGGEEPHSGADGEKLLVLVVVPALPDDCAGEIAAAVLLRRVDALPEGAQVLQVVRVADVQLVVRVAEDDVERLGDVAPEQNLERSETS